MHINSIIAQSTPSGKGALALIRLSGEDSFEIVDKISYFSHPKKIADQKSHTIHYGWVVDVQGDKIDQVLFLVMRAPHTFTGEHTVEITCHNNPFIIENIIQQALRQGARLAQPGEFTRRAFENKKLDLVQAEAINELLCAQTETALKKSLAQLDGSLSHWMENIEGRLVKAYAWSEASFEFLDEAGDFGLVIKQQLTEVTQAITQALKTFEVQKQIREGFRIALIGSVNAGKSSLFNKLLAQERSIVTDIAGTTRDTVEAGLYRNGNHWTLIDTAGLRQTEDVVEKQGIKRSFDEAHKADIVILVIDGAREMSAQEKEIYSQLYEQYAHKTIVVVNKMDEIALAPFDTNRFAIHSGRAEPARGAPRPPTSSDAEGVVSRSEAARDKIVSTAPAIALATAGPFERLKVSTVTNLNIALLEQHIETKINALLATSDAPFLLNKRQHALLLTLEQQIKEIIKMLEGEIQYELVSYHVREALESISFMTGKTISEAAMDKVFREFCVGK